MLCSFIKLDNVIQVEIDSCAETSHFLMKYVLGKDFIKLDVFPW